MAHIELPIKDTKWGREDFEKWCKRQSPPLSTDRNQTGYIEWATSFAWAGWRAAMSKRKMKRRSKTCTPTKQQ